MRPITAFPSPIKRLSIAPCAIVQTIAVIFPAAIVPQNHSRISALRLSHRLMAKILKINCKSYRLNISRIEIKFNVFIPAHSNIFFQIILNTNFNYRRQDVL